jgi:hypothetical protein
VTIKSYAKALAGFLILLLMGLHGALNLIHWYSTGKLWANFSHKGEPSNYQLISYDDHPMNFIGLFGIHLLFVVLGLAGCFLFLRWIWLNMRASRA